MIYTKSDVYKELKRYFTEDVSGNNDDIVCSIEQNIQNIYGQTNILKACNIIRDSIVNIKNTDGKRLFEDKKYLPQWVRYLVYVVIYDYLIHKEGIVDTYISKMGLSKDYKEKCYSGKKYKKDDLLRIIANEKKKDIIIPTFINETVNTALCTSTTDEACRIIGESILNSAEGMEKEYIKNPPKWLCSVINAAINKDFYSQSDLLVEMGLYTDIFGKKNWCMYSPDMKFRQNRYNIIELPFNHSEIESSDILRAMVHHITCYSKVLTDSFVDVFGKLGIIPVLCANGYDNTDVLLNSERYKELIVFKTALSKKKRVCKLLKEIQYEISHPVNNSNGVRYRKAGRIEEQLIKIPSLDRLIVLCYIGTYKALVHL